MIIDENWPVRELLARRLASVSDIEVVGATGDSEEGLRQIQEYSPHIVLLDIKMNRADGLDICRRACAINSNAIVVVLTGYTDREERKRAYQIGASSYLLKEANTSKLARQITQLSRGSEVRTEC